MAMATYDNEPVLSIRIGDVVRDKNGTYTADSSAETDQWGEIAVRNGSRWVTYVKTDTVSITFEEVSENSYV